MALDHWVNYEVCPCSLEITSGAYGDNLSDTAGFDRYTQLPATVFLWLINIRLGHLVTDPETDA